MRKSHLLKGVGIVIAVLLGVGAMTPFYAGASQDGVALKICGMPFNQFVTELVKQKGGKKLLLLENVSTPVDIVAPDSTPVDKILASVSKTVGLDFWQDEDTYYIGHQNKSASQVVPTPLPSNDYSVLPKDDTTILALPTLQSPVTKPQEDKTAVVESSKPVIGSIELKYTSASEIAWMLGAAGGVSPNANRKKTLNHRIDTLLNPRQPQVNGNSGGQYTSPIVGSSSPWLSGILSRNSATDSYQNANVPFGGFNPGGFNPGGMGQVPAGGFGQNPGNFGGGYGGQFGGGNGGYGQNGQYNQNDPNGNNNNNNNGAGLLRSFIPDGVEWMVGIESLNKLLVRAKTQESIDQLADFIKMLDQPTKQALIEVMFVKMRINDATSLGSSWSITGNPWQVNSTNAPTTGNTAVQYTSGNIRVQLAALIQETRAKIVNAPRIIVQNGGEASIELTDNMPFVVTSEDEDVYGKVTKVPTINMQSFSQGLDVNKILIHPDDSVTLEVDPILEDPSEAVDIPGANNSGSVRGSSSQEIDTRVRVQNGQTIMMGGFISNSETNTSYKTPLLSNIPVLGPLLFKSRSMSLSNTETLIFITPTVLKDDTTSLDGMVSLPPLF